MAVDRVRTGQLAAGEALFFPVRRRRWSLRLAGSSVAVLLFAGALAYSTRFDGSEKTFVVAVALLGLLIFVVRAVSAAVILATLRPVRIDSAGVRSGDRVVEWDDIQVITSRPGWLKRRLRWADEDVKVVSRSGSVVITHDHVENVSDLVDLLNAEAAKHR